MSRSRGFALIASSLLAAAGAAALQPEIRGRVYEGDHDHPVPGALVALYDTGDLLLDSTYTRDDGGFRLRPPQQKAKVYVVATQGSRSHREELDYEPAGPGKLVWIGLPRNQESRLIKAGRWVLDELGAVVGLLVGYFFRVVVEERGAAKRKRDDFIFDVRDLAIRALASYEKNDREPPRAELTTAVRQIRQLIDRRHDMADVLSTLTLLKKQEGRRRFRNLNDKLKEAEDLLAEVPSLADNKKEKNFEKAKGILEEIRDRPLG